MGVHCLSRTSRGGQDFADEGHKIEAPPSPLDVFDRFPKVGTKLQKQKSQFVVNIPHLTGITAGTFQFWQEYFLMIIFQIFNVPKQLSDPENLS